VPVDTNRDGIPDTRSPYAPAHQVGTYRKERNKALNRRRRKTQKKRDKVAPIDNQAERVSERTGKNVSTKPPKRARRNGSRPRAAAPAPAAAPRRAAGSVAPSVSSPSASAAQASSGGGGGGGTTAAPRTGASGTASARGSSTSQQAPGTAVQQYKPFDVAGFYSPAIDNIAKMRAASDATRQNQLDNLGKINEWYMKAQGQGQEALKSAMTASQGAATTATQAAQGRTQDYLTKAVQALGGNGDLMRSSGVSAALTANQQQENVAAQDVAFNERQGQALQARQDDERAIWSARTDNMRNTINSNHLQRAMGMDQQETALRTEMGKTDLAERQRVQGLNESAKQAAAQAEIDQSMANFTMGIKSGELAVKQYTAQTERLTARNRANLDAQTLKIKAAGLDLQSQKLQLQRWVEKQRVSDKEKDRMLKVGLAKLGGGAGGAGAAGETGNSYMDAVESNFGKPLNQLDRHQYGQVAHGLINWLAAKRPNMSRVQAARVLRSYFDSSVTGDARIKRALRTTFGA
jgi:hypothetical protein